MRTEKHNKVENNKEETERAKREIDKRIGTNEGLVIRKKNCG